MMGDEHEAEHIELRRQFRTMGAWRMFKSHFALSLAASLLVLALKLMSNRVTPTTRRALIDLLFMVDIDHDVADEGSEEAVQIARRRAWTP